MNDDREEQKNLSEGESYVEDRIQSAARTLRRMPDVKVQGYFSTWPTIIREPLEILQMEPEPMRLYPSQKSITDMEEVLFVWLKWLEPDERRLVWLSVASVLFGARQAGRNAERVDQLKKSLEVKNAQLRAILDAPRTRGELVDRLRNGKF